MKTLDRKKATPKVMRLIDPYTGKMECKACGSVHWASIMPQSGGRYYRGSWQCIYKCRIEDRDAV